MKQNKNDGIIMTLLYLAQMVFQPLITIQFLKTELVCKGQTIALIRGGGGGGGEYLYIHVLPNFEMN